MGLALLGHIWMGKLEDHQGASDPWESQEASETLPRAAGWSESCPLHFGAGPEPFTISCL